MTPVVIMCGGRGERLHALTQHTPKSMLPIGDKPMIQTLVEEFRDQGFKKIWLCVHYKAEQIEAHFGNGERWGCKIYYTHEREPLGTAGPLALLPRARFQVPFIVMNADVVTRVKFGHLMSHHAEQGGQATMAVALHQYQVPFGVARMADNGWVRAIDEKPIENHYVNAGLYVLDPSVIEGLAPRHLDMPELLDSLDQVAHYPIHDYWRDLGRFEDLESARAAAE